MTLTTIPVVQTALTELAADSLVLFVHEGATQAPPALRGTGAGAVVERLLNSREITGKLAESLPVLGPLGLAAQGMLVVGLGPPTGFGPGAAFTAGVAAAKCLSKKPRDRVAVAAPTDCDGAAVSELAAGLIVGQRGPGLRKKSPGRHAFGALSLVADGPLSQAVLEAACRRGVIVGEAVNLARELANLPPGDKPPHWLAARALEVAGDAGFQAEVWDVERLRREAFGGVLGVASGSDQPPAFVVLSYRGGADQPTTALVGKGVTFDSGGLTLKPNDSMLDMKADMTGAAVVLATFQAAARLGLPVNLAGYLPMTENLAGGRALKLGDVLTIRNGTTVEVHNTDAEGRLILADALSYAVERKPARVIDLATLTGACMVALGTRVAGLFSNNDVLADGLLRACARSGERAWRMPLDEDYEEQLKSTVADLKNVGTRWGGAVCASKFLQRFVAGAPWAHLDIAGPSWSDADGSTRDAGATGCFVRTLIGFLEAEVAEPARA